MHFNKFKVTRGNNTDFFELLMQTSGIIILKNKAFIHCFKPAAIKSMPCVKKYYFTTPSYASSFCQSMFRISLTRTTCVCITVIFSLHMSNYYK